MSNDLLLQFSLRAYANGTPPIIDAVEVYGMNKEEFGWTEKVSQEGKTTKHFTSFFTFELIVLSPHNKNR